MKQKRQPIDIIKEEISAFETALKDMPNSEYVNRWIKMKETYEYILKLVEKNEGDEQRQILEFLESVIMSLYLLQTVIAETWKTNETEADND